jgi:hypothetical protein
MMSCILVFYLLLFSATPDVRPGIMGVQSPASSPGESADPDALYAKRQDIPSAQQAAKIWQSRPQKNLMIESAGSRAATYWIGTQGPEAERKDARHGNSGRPHGGKARGEQA